MRSSIVLVSSLLAVSALAADPPAKRVPFPNAGISVVMHGKAKLEDTSQGIQPPNQRLWTSYRDDTRREVATLMRIKLAPAEYEQALELVLDSHRKDGIRNLKKTTALGRPARDFVKQIGRFEIWMRTLIVPAGIVELHLAGPKGSVTEAEAQAYFASLQPLETKKK